MTELPLSGRRVVVVEDNALVSLQLQQMLQRLGCVVAGSAAQLDEAHHLCMHTAFDVAVLDVNLRGEKVYPLACTLVSRDQPFVLATGYDIGVLPPALHASILIEKPYRSHDVAQALLRALAA